MLVQVKEVSFEEKTVFNPLSFLMSTSLGENDNQPDLLFEIKYLLVCGHFRIQKTRDLEEIMGAKDMQWMNCKECEK